VVDNPAYYRPARYSSKHAPWGRLYLFAWRTIGAFIFRLMPSRFFRVRNLILRVYGARVARTAFVHPTCRIYSPRTLSVGERSCLSARVDCYCVADVVIGDDVTVSQDAFLCTASHDIDLPDRPLTAAPIRVDRGAWVFARATILPGVTVGEGAVVAACAVVTKDVKPHAVVAGNPAIVVRERRFHGAGNEAGS
jgi:putative colanic acid biosynthesis acetyltransferase WcaF